MTTDQASLPQRVAKYYSVLSAAAKDLNSISDELGKSIAEVDFALKKLNLGVVVWVPIRKDDGTPQQESWFWTEDIGYAKIGPNWGISLRKINGDYQDPDHDNEERWLFNDAPRTLRISAIEKIPELLEKLSSEAVKTTKEIGARLAEAQAVAEAVKGAANTIQRVPLERVPLRVPTSVSKDSTTLANPNEPSVNSLRSAVISALADAGHASAAQLLGAGAWTLDGDSIRIEVAGTGKKMLALTVNAAAEKIIRQKLQQLGGPARFMIVPGVVVPGEAMEKTSASTSASGILPDALEGVEK